ncbi:hypothetical protein QJS67_12565 [Acinetobacter radioresistens]|nr:hypothetical protein QJS67_12565 [Acinetobacter radioresistens]
MKCLKKVMIFSIGLVISSSPSVAKEINKIEKNIRVIKYPISSNFYSECRENKSEKECKKISDIKDYSYKSTKILKELPVEGRFLSDGKIKDLNVDNFRFISKGNDIVYSIAEKYVDTDEEAKSEFYLIKIKPKLEIEKIGANSNMRCDSFKSHMIINKLSKFL